MTKITITSLQEEIGRLKADKQSWYEKYRELKDAEEKRDQFNLGRLKEEQNQTERQVTNLMEVIRWQINPDTAKSPYMPTKSERGDNKYN